MKKLVTTIAIALGMHIHAQICFEPMQIFKTITAQSKVTTSSIISADFNGDGKADVASSNGFNNTSGTFFSTVSVLLGTGTGSFTGAANFDVDDGANQLITADFNGDGKIDLATSNYYYPKNISSVSVLLGTGTGSFLPATSFWSGFAPASITSADFNGDGFADFATANPQLEQVWVSLGNGAGNFGAASSFTVGGYPSSVISADFNGDGKVDLATANGDSNNVSILLGNGTGSFATATSFTAGIWSWSDPDANHNGGVATSLITADFNGDSKADLAVAHNDTNIISILLGNGAGSFGPVSNFSVDAKPSPSQMISADFNGDGKTDLATANTFIGVFPNLVITSNTLSVLLGNGAGSFGTPTSYTVGDRPNWVISADFNGDGKADLAAADTAVSVLLNCTAMGIEKVTDNDVINIYPNPGNGNFVIESTNATKQTVQLFDINGRLVFTQSISGKTMIDASTLNEGVYNISIIDKEGLINKRLVIVK